MTNKNKELTSGEKAVSKIAVGFFKFFKWFLIIYFGIALIFLFPPLAFIIIFILVLRKVRKKTKWLMTKKQEKNLWKMN